MKNKIKHIGKRSLSVILVLMMVFSMTIVGTISSSAATIPNSTKLYFDVSNITWWLNDNAVTDVYFYGTSGSTWEEMELVSDESYVFECTTPSTGTYENLIFVRKASHSEDWNKYNQTGDITNYTSSNNCYVLNSSNSGGTWTTYTPTTDPDTTEPITTQPASTEKDLYLYGNYDKNYLWNDKTSGAKFSYVSGNTYTLTVQFSGSADGVTDGTTYPTDNAENSYFRIYNSTDGIVYGNPASSNTVLTNGSTSTITTEGTDNGAFEYAVGSTPKTVTITVDISAMTLAISEVVPDSTKLAYVKNEDSALWFDAAPDMTEATSTLIRWNNYNGSIHSDTKGTEQVFYVPANVDLSNITVYNGYDNAVVLDNDSNLTVPANSSATLNLATKTYNVTGGYTGSLTVKQGSTNVMFLETTSDLPTATGAGATKDSVELSGGSCITMTYNNDTESYDSSASLALKSVKGRGNSSWEASHTYFGKYAYNIKFDKKQALFGMDTSKSWCLLANNADESMLRNALTYDLANEIGLPNSPEFSFVDIYDNSEYLGSYLVTEKVDVGDNNLVKGESIDDINEDAAKEAGVDIKSKTLTSTYEYNGATYDYKYAETVGDNASAYDPDYSEGTFLLEFEIESRVNNEASWFQSPKGQYVVVKSPEYASQEQVLDIAKKFAEMEATVYADNASLDSLASYIDVDSFARMYLIQELSSNLDSAATSYYLTYSMTDGIFVASPVWDYDWAYGQYWKTVKKGVGTNYYLDPNNPTAWYARDKQMGDNQANVYSVQSQLAHNSNFQTVIKKVWNGTETQKGFYDIVKTYYSSVDGNTAQIDAWYNSISDSVEMNEYRWHFIEKNLLGTEGNNDSWGSANTGDDHNEAVTYLKTTWTQVRAEWLNTQFADVDYTPITPTFKAYNAEGTEITDGVTFGEKVTIALDTVEAFVTYELFDGETSLGTINNGTIEVNPSTTGIHTYKVVATYDSNTNNSSKSITVTPAPTPVIEPALTTSASKVAVGGSFKLTATPSDSSYTYTFYKDGTDTALSSTGNTCTVTETTAGTYSYYVVINDGETNYTSEKISVTVEESGSTENKVKIWFKSAGSVIYTPSVSLDNGTFVVMEKINKGLENSTYIGANASGSLKFYWYFTELTIDSTKQHTFTFKTADTKVNVTSEAGYFSDSEYYFAVDNLVNGTTLVQYETGTEEYIRNYHHTASHMVYAGVADDGTLGYTYIEGREYAMGSISATQTTSLVAKTSALNTPVLKTAKRAPFSVDSVTMIQMTTARITTVSDLQNDLFDVNLDGVVDVNDATLIQLALVS